MRCFVAIDVNSNIKKNIAKVQKHFNRPEIKLVEKENLHITLKFLGDVNNVDKIIKKLKDISWNPFTTEFKGLGVFPNKNYIKVIWVGARSEALEDLAKKIQTKLGRDDFVPHVTIARVKQRIDKLETISVPTTFGTQLVDCFCLKKSTLTKDGPIYTTLSVFYAKG